MQAELWSEDAVRRARAEEREECRRLAERIEQESQRVNGAIAYGASLVAEAIKKRGLEQREKR